MSIDWFRHWHGMSTDPKFRAVAKRAGRPTCEVVSLFSAMMENASANDDDRGSLRNWCHEDMGVAFDIEPEHVAAIHQAMQGKLLDGDRLMGWERRQPKREDGSAERAKEWRERKRTQANAIEQNRPTDTDSEEEKEKEPPLPPAELVEPERVKGLMNGLGELGSERHEEITAETMRSVANTLGVEDVAPLVKVFETWPGSAKARDRNKMFSGSAPTLWKNASATVRAACKPLPTAPPIEPLPSVKASPSLLASLPRSSRHAAR